MTIGKRIKAARKERHMTQEQLASFLGVKTAAVSKYENELVSPSWETITKISAAFNMTTTKLLDGVNLFSEPAPESDFDAADQLRADTIAKYDGLNDLGREKANEYITDLSELGKYKRS